MANLIGYLDYGHHAGIVHRLAHQVIFSKLATWEGKIETTLHKDGSFAVHVNGKEIATGNVTPPPHNYKGKYLHTITADDVKNPYNDLLKTKLSPYKLLQTMGRLLSCDIGKEVYEQSSGIYQVENDEQLKTRLNKNK